jgi:hypothetical protein
MHDDQEEEQREDPDGHEPYELAECAAGCGTETRLRCAPCGDPVCHNCRCPNGCDHGATLQDMIEATD